MKNKDVWNVAQKYGGISMMILGLINAIIGIWSIFKPLIINNRKIQELFLLISVIVMIIVDEIHLRKVFNKDGSRKGNIIN
ncbi:Na+/proline symporter [Clostridium algifaecis]|uniref:Na+/proline symporter n=2 Tax=Clostridium algifaecis TaxID=1472040 RepID=A0ABS4KRE3_9CLOT|nr:Na+/proline symporter [Clostridium algifaecis]